MFNKKKPEVDSISVDENIDDDIDSFAEVSSIFVIAVLIIVFAIAFLIIAFAWHIPVKEIFEGVISVCFIGIIIYGLATLVNPDPEIISRKKTG